MTMQMEMTVSKFNNCDIRLPEETIGNHKFIWSITQTWWLFADGCVSND